VVEDVARHLDAVEQHLGGAGSGELDVAGLTAAVAALRARIDSLSTT
jgi:hypothetical protein